MRASEYVAQEVNNCRDDDEIVAVGEVFYSYHLRVCE